MFTYTLVHKQILELRNMQFLYIPLYVFFRIPVKTMENNPGTNQDLSMVSSSEACIGLWNFRVLEDCVDN